MSQSWSLVSEGGATILFQKDANGKVLEQVELPKHSEKYEIETNTDGSAMLKDGSEGTPCDLVMKTLLGSKQQNQKDDDGNDAKGQIFGNSAFGFYIMYLT